MYEETVHHHKLMNEVMNSYVEFAVTVAIKNSYHTMITDNEAVHNFYAQCLFHDEFPVMSSLSESLDVVVDFVK